MAKKIKKFLALVLLACALAPAVSEGADIVVLMDASGTILPWFDEINSKVLVDITRKFVREGDTFHLISFNSRVNLEIVQPIGSEADVSRVVSRFMLLYPLGQNSDFLSGLHYTWQYVSTLEQSREKVVIVISDGIFNPPADSPYASYNNDQVKADIAQISRQIRGAGWSVYYVKLPFPEDAEITTLDGKSVSVPQDAKASKGSKKAATTGSDSKEKEGANAERKKYVDISSEFESALDIGVSELQPESVPNTFVDSLFSMPEVAFPDDLGKRGRNFVLPLRLKNVSDKTVNMELTGVYWEDIDVLGKNAFLNLSPGASGTLRAEIRLPETVALGPQELPLSLRFSGGTRVNPQSGTVRLTVIPFSPEMFFVSGASLALSAILVAIALLFVFILVIVVVRKTARPVPDAVSAAATAESMAERDKYRGTASAEPARAKHAGKPFGSPGKSLFGERSSSDNAAREVLSNAARPERTGLSALSEIDVAKDVDRKSLLASMATKEDKQIHYSVERDESADRNVAVMASALAEERAARLSVLTDAAKKYAIHETARSGASASEPIVVRESGNVMLELSVSNQNTNIGKRNVHMMRAGSRLSIGGGRSAFLIFLVRFPSNIAEIRFDGKQCSLAILKPEYFPYETENVIEDCVGRDFVAVSDKGYEVAFTVKVYEDPVVKLNRLLKSII